MSRQSQPARLADFHKQVIEYLLKKGYNRTEQTLRLESANVDREGKQIQERVEELGTAKYAKGFRLLSAWIEGNLEIYKVRIIHSTLTKVSFIGGHQMNFRLFNLMK